MGSAMALASSRQPRCESVLVVLCSHGLGGLAFWDSSMYDAPRVFRYRDWLRKSEARFPCCEDLPRVPPSWPAGSHRRLATSGPGSPLVYGRYHSTVLPTVQDCVRPSRLSLSPARGSGKSSWQLGLPFGFGFGFQSRRLRSCSAGRTAART
jgi:hypothetical protein